MAKAKAWLLGLLTVACGGRSPTPDTASIRITSPGAGSAIRAGSVQVQVASQGLVPEQVSLLVDGVEIARTGSAPYVFTWSSGQTPEGAHTLLAQAVRGTQNWLSDPVSVTVDRTVPTVVSRAPSPLEANADDALPIQITFSEAMDPASLQSGALTLIVILYPDTLTDTPTVTWSADGKRLTLHPSKAPLHGSIAVSLPRTLTDLAGNALVIPPDLWTWTAPEYLAACDAPVGATAHRVVMSPGGQSVFLVTIDGSLTVGACQIVGDGSRCTPLPSPGTGFNGFAAAAADDGELWVLAGHQTVGGPVDSSSLFSWNGAAWSTVPGPAILSLPWPPLSLAAGASGALAITQRNASTQPVTLVTSVRSGGGWHDLDPIPDDPPGFGELFLDDGSLLLFAPLSPTAQLTEEWNGTAWAADSFALGVQTLYAPTLIPSRHAIYAATSSSSSGTVVVQRFDGQSWTPFGTFSGTHDLYGPPVGYVTASEQLVLGLNFASPSDGTGEQRMEIIRSQGGALLSLDPAGTRCGTMPCSLAPNQSGTPMVILFGLSSLRWNE